MENEFSQIYRHQKYQQEHFIHYKKLLTEIVEGFPPRQQIVCPAMLENLDGNEIYYDHVNIDFLPCAANANRLASKCCGAYTAHSAADKRK